MKNFFYNIVVYSLICLTTLSLVTPVNAETFDNNTVESSVQNHSEFPSTIIVDGVEKKVRVVNLQEYNEDTSGDFLILINNGVNYIINKTINSSGCVWSGPRVGGVWLCPMSVDIEYFKEAL